MANISDTMADLAIVRELTLQKFKNSHSQDVSNAYQIIIDDISSSIRNADAITLKNMRKTILELKERVTPDLEFVEPDLNELANIEASYTASSVNAMAGMEVFKNVPSDAALSNIYKSTLMQGAVLKDWYKSLDASMQKDLDKAIKLGVSIGEDNHTLAKRVEKSLGVSKRHSKTIAITGASTVSNQARHMTYESNDDVIKGWEYLATLDKRTSDFCKAYSRKTWDMDKKPIGHKFPFRQPPHQTHWRCRSQILPILKSWKEMGIDMEEIGEGTQSSLDGAISSDISFNDWLKTKDKKFVDDLLGKGRAKLFLDGKITTSDLINQRGETLSLKELKALNKKPVVPKVAVPKIDLGYKGKYNHNFVDIIDDAKIVIDKLPKPSKITTGSGGFVWEENRIIIPKNGRLIALHEYGHHIDHKLMDKDGVFLSTTRLKKATELDIKHLGLDFGSESKPIKLKELELDFMEQIEVTITKGKWKGSKAKKWVAKDDYRERWSGMVDNITDGHFRDNYNASGHGRKYFKSKDYLQQTENFADLFALWSDGSKWDETKKMFPNLTKEFEIIMSEI
ncbi:MAG: phage minor head protein [Campylobacterota bacterium]|nr:phage minor head protein [Campylobacterota bacterium]